jgi:hypothetical protein
LKFFHLIKSLQAGTGIIFAEQQNGEDYLVVESLQIGGSAEEQAGGQATTLTV